jgi:hypothetical protein
MFSLLPGRPSRGVAVQDTVRSGPHCNARRSTSRSLGASRDASCGTARHASVLDCTPTPPAMARKQVIAPDPLGCAATPARAALSVRVAVLGLGRCYGLRFVLIAKPAIGCMGGSGRNRWTADLGVGSPSLPARLIARVTGASDGRRPRGGAPQCPMPAAQIVHTSTGRGNQPAQAKTGPAKPAEWRETPADCCRARQTERRVWHSRLPTPMCGRAQSCSPTAG